FSPGVALLDSTGVSFPDVLVWVRAGTPDLAAFVPGAFFLPDALTGAFFLPGAFLGAFFLPGAFLGAFFLPGAFLGAFFLPGAFLDAFFLARDFLLAVAFLPADGLAEEPVLLERGGR